MAEQVETRSGGDGHIVLVLPGFTAGDWSNLPLAAVLRRAGVKPKRWRLGSNQGPTDEIVAGLNERLRDLYDREGRKVSVIGVSLGGIYARRLGRDHPDLVRQVITIGSPFRFHGTGRSATVMKIWEGRLDGFDPAFVEEMYTDEDLKEPFGMPVTSIYTRNDDVVRWHQCLLAHGDQSQNIEIRGANHVGLVAHPGVHYAIHDRVRQPEGAWRRFRAPSRFGMWYRRAEIYDPQYRS
jgi:pimeloyl-ACP methyl ester carboxylesterase